MVKDHKGRRSYINL